MRRYENRTSQQCHDFEVKYEYEEVLRHAESCLKDQLEDKAGYRGINLYNTVPTEEQIQMVNDAYYQAAYDIAHYYGEAWHKFLVKIGRMSLTRNFLPQEMERFGK